MLDLHFRKRNRRNLIPKISVGAHRCYGAGKHETIQEQERYFIRKITTNHLFLDFSQMNFLSKIPTFGLERILDIDVRSSISMPEIEVNKKTVTYGVAWVASVMALGYIGFRAFLHLSDEKKKKNMSDYEDL